MLTHFGTLFAVPHLPSLLTHFNTFNTPLLLLNFHKNNVSRGTVRTDVSRGTKGDLLKRLKLKLLHYLTKIIWWFREKVVSLQRNNLGDDVSNSLTLTQTVECIG